MTIASVLLIGLVPPASTDFNRGMSAFTLEDYSTALREWRSAGRAGDARAQQAIGYLYMAGKGVPQDFAKAHKWFEIAAANLPPGEARGRGNEVTRPNSRKALFRNIQAGTQAGAELVEKIYVIRFDGMPTWRQNFQTMKSSSVSPRNDPQPFWPPLSPEIGAKPIRLS